MKLVISSKAERDLRSIARYLQIESGSKFVALNFIRSLRQKCQHIAYLPFQIGTARPELGANIRSYAFGNYMLLFRYEVNCLRILTVTEGHREIENTLH